MQMVALFCTWMKGGCFPFLICFFCSAMVHLAMWNLSDGDVISACISKDAFMKADESGINIDFTEKSTDWIGCYSLQKVHRCQEIQSIIFTYSQYGPRALKIEDIIHEVVLVFNDHSSMLCIYGYSAAASQIPE